MLQDKRVAVIFAGGKSSRMGRDKSLLPFGGYSTLAHYQYQRLSSIFDEVYISAKEDKFDFESDLILDRYSESSPLVGLVSIFESTDIDEAFVLSVDAPFIDSDIIDTIYDHSIDNSSDVIVAKSPQGLEPLCAIYRRSILLKSKIFLEQNNHRLNALIGELDTTIVEFKSDKRFDNLNYYHEYIGAIEGDLS
ncbi:Molybdopterin-guanine dinucleotide biosynthesis protein MobA [hydrothermal vent metagenome]|uniref:Molybdopterin-guanine dinucleotide biosynthesis protein MobA n=1 Tax=hydrothermal vent metagenome TaxID=652676 RepID=A0A1W1BRK8_9ZZZZ